MQAELSDETVSIVVNAIAVAAHFAIIGIPVRVFVKYVRQWTKLKS